jgi:hypothetical protein
LPKFDPPPVTIAYGQLGKLSMKKVVSVSTYFVRGNWNLLEFSGRIHKSLMAGNWRSTRKSFVAQLEEAASR